MSRRHVEIFGLFLLLTAAVAAPLALESKLVRDGALRHFGIALPWSEAIALHATWSRRLDALRSIEMDAASVVLWKRAGCPEEWPDFDEPAGETDDEAEDWVLAFLLTHPECPAATKPVRDR